MGALSTEGILVKSLVLRTIIVVANFIGCHEKTVIVGLIQQERLNGLVFKIWLVKEVTVTDKD